MDLYFSIIVPVYNSEKTLTTCVQSVQAQHFDSYELILVNDGSSDSSGHLCETLASMDSHIFVLNKKNGGVSSARNVGLEVAKGRYVAFIDSDDTVKPGWLQSIYERNQSIGADVIFFGLEMVQNGRVRSESKVQDFVAASKQAFSLNFEECYQKLFGSVCTKVYSSSILRQNGITFDESLHVYEDAVFDFTFFPHANRFLNIGQVFYTYYQTPFSASHKGRTDILTAGEVRSHHLKTLLEGMGLMNLYPSLSAAEVDQRIYAHYLQGVIRSSKLTFKQRRQILSEIYSNSEFRAVLAGHLACLPPSLSIYLGRLSVCLRWPSLLAFPASLLMYLHSF